MAATGNFCGRVFCFESGFRNVFNNLRNTTATGNIQRFRCMSFKVSSNPETQPRKRKDFRRMKSLIYKQNRQDPKMEKAARLGHLRIPLDVVRREWNAKHGAEDTRKLARHYGIYEHMFGGTEFTPSVEMRVCYGEECEVHKGNVITPTQASCQPVVDLQSITEDSGFWTLLLTNLDGNVFKEHMELLHYLVVNIPGNNVSSGQTLCQYLPPAPPKGTGYHRMVFCLMKQTEEMDMDHYLDTFSRNLSSRTFSTAHFLSNANDKLAPAAVKFFQTSWDDSVSLTYTENLGMAAPCYEAKPFTTPTKKRTVSTRRTFETKYRNM